MSKKVNAIIKDKTTIVLTEDALTGDYIDLANLVNVDLANLEKQLSDAKDTIYQKKLAEAKGIWQESHNQELALQESKLTSQYKEAIQNLEQKLKTAELEANNKYQASLRVQEVKEAKEKQQLELVIAELKSQLATADLKAKDAYQEKLIEVQKAHQADLDAMHEKYDQLNSAYQFLKNQKAATNNKALGDNLEKACDALVLEALQAGLANCTWEKDTKPKKDGDEDKATKADYIFKVYSTPEHLSSQLLTSICLEMKDENPDSKEQKTNEDHYKKLNSDRNKNNCKYALLVSTLDFKNENIPPIYRVLDYPDMYVVRPAYMMTFLNMVVSLTMRFQDLILSSINNEINLKKQTEFLVQFESLKTTYLDKPLDSLTKKVNEIMKQTEAARTSINNVDKLCVEIINQYIEAIASKLDKFDAGMKTNYRKLDK